MGLDNTGDSDMMESSIGSCIMDYETACEATVSKIYAIREVQKHGLDPDEFFAEVGERDSYRGHEVLDWLGY